MQAVLNAYVNHKAGPLTNAPTCTGFSSLEKIQPNFPDSEQHIQSLVDDYVKKYPDADKAGRDTLIARQLLDPKEAVCQLILAASGANIEFMDQPGKMFPSTEKENWMLIGVCSTRSLSRGTIHINSADPTAHPSIDPAYVSDLSGRKLLREIY